LLATQKATGGQNQTIAAAMLAVCANELEAMIKRTPNVE
jgi:hypothetical protein